MRSPLILAFDTSAAHCAAALLRGDRIVAERAEPMVKGQAEYLFPMLEQMLGDAGVTWSDLTALGVGTGPGNFTGVRIAVAAARGLALSLGIPAHGVTGFEALALDQPRPVLALIDARAGRLYGQVFGPAGADAPFMVEPGEGLPRMPASLTVVGHEAAERAAGIAARPVTAPHPVAAAIARIAATRPDGQARPAPLYLRPADAAPSRDGPPLLLP